MSEMITRSQYLADKTPGAHQRYYSQFVTSETREHIRRHFGVDRLTKTFAEDRHLNSIPLNEWDSAGVAMPVADIWGEVGDFATLAGMTCIAKEAATQLLHPCFAGK